MPRYYSHDQICFFEVPGLDAMTCLFKPRHGLVVTLLRRRKGGQGAYLILPDAI
jgi:hypothetical protein